MRRKYRKDDWRPDRKKGNPWPSVLGKVKPTAQAMKYARKIWKQAGYKGE